MSELMVRAIQAAEAVYEAHGADTSCMPEAIRAAIEAMRGATEPMVIAAHNTVGPGFCDEPADPMDPAEAWDAMIGEILNPAAAPPSFREERENGTLMTATAWNVLAAGIYGGLANRPK